MRVSDDRGFLVRVIPAYQLIGPGAIWCPLPRDIRRSVFMQISRLSPRGAAQSLVLATILLCGSTALAASAVGTLTILLTRGSWISIPIVAVLIPATILGVLHFSAWLARDRVVSLIRTQSYCATCGYCLQGLEPEPDRCVVCPECQSAWRAAVRFGWKHPTEL